MTEPPQTTVTRLLEAVRAGDRTALDKLYPLVYDELRAQAHRQRRHWRGDHTLDTVALVNEAYLKLAGQTPANLQSRAHFLAVAAKAMRYILLDYAKQRRTQKRGGDWKRLAFDEIKEIFEGGLVLSEERADALVALDEALEHLARFDERQSQVVECRFYGNMTIKQTAEALGISVATVNRDWGMAKTWLYREIARSMGR